MHPHRSRKGFSARFRSLKASGIYWTLFQSAANKRSAVEPPIKRVLAPLAAYRLAGVLFNAALPCTCRLLVSWRNACFQHKTYGPHKTYTTYTTYKNKVLSGRSAHREDRANGVAGNFSSPSGAIKKSGSLFLQRPRSFQLNFPEKRIRQVRSFLPIPDPRHPGTLPLYPADFPDRC